VSASCQAQAWYGGRAARRGLVRERTVIHAKEGGALAICVELGTVRIFHRGAPALHTIATKQKAMAASGDKGPLRPSNPPPPMGYRSIERRQPRTAGLLGARARAHACARPHGVLQGRRAVR